MAYKRQRFGMRYYDMKFAHAILPVERWPGVNIAQLIADAFPKQINIVNSQVKLHLAYIARPKQVDGEVVFI
jgi:hypothetical protein